MSAEYSIQSIQELEDQIRELNAEIKKLIDKILAFEGNTD